MSICLERETEKALKTLERSQELCTELLKYSQSWSIMHSCSVHDVMPLQIMISCTKGILNDSLETVNQVLERVLPHDFHNRLAYLSGPSFAAEVASLFIALPGTGKSVLDATFAPCYGCRNSVRCFISEE